jgi:hypothetical protein
MPLPLVWTDSADTRLRRLRAEGATWPEIAAAFGLNTSTVIARANRIGARPPPPEHVTEEVSDFRDPSRPALPPGHSASWGALVAGTVLEGAPFVPVPEVVAPPPLVTPPRLANAA